MCFLVWLVSAHGTRTPDPHTFMNDQGWGADHPQLGRSMPSASKWAEYRTRSSVSDQNIVSIRR